MIAANFFFLMGVCAGFVLQKDAACGNELQLPGRPAGFVDKSRYPNCRHYTLKHVLQAFCFALPFSCSVYLILMQAQLKLPPPIPFNRLWMFVLLQTQVISPKDCPKVLEIPLS